MKLENKIALITGGGRGIGRAIALAFASEGANVAVAARTLEQVEQVAREIADLFHMDALPIVCDVSNVASVEKAFTTVSENFGRGCDILVNNAGIAESATIVNTDDELWQRHLAINLNGTFYCTRAAIPQMIERGWGRIINVASIAGKIGAPYIAAYSASKHGVVGLTRSAAMELATKGITVNAICPGYVDTDMTTRGVERITQRTGLSADDAMDALRKMSPQNRIIVPEEVGPEAVGLSSEYGRGINGEAMKVEGGRVFY
jgi:NAD(P)-dependent dehydrogenase (short-subunit alcohol dehydrogenase family)